MSIRSFIFKGDEQLLKEGFTRALPRLGITLAEDVAAEGAAGEVAAGAVAILAPEVLAAATAVVIVVAVGYYGGKYIAKGTASLMKLLYDDTYSGVNFLEKEYHKWL